MQHKPNEWAPVQYRRALETIAAQASALHQLLILTTTEEDEWRRAVFIDAADSLAVLIGAMADGASGDQVVGNAECWFYGPAFAADTNGGAA